MFHIFKKKTNQSELLVDYGFLLFGFAVTGLLIRALQLSQEYILFATVPLSIGYILWGILHHKRHGHIDKKIALEYISMALLVNVVVAVLVW